MKFLHQTRLNRANYAVRAELARLGFYDHLLAGVAVRLVPIGCAYGWQYYGASGDICVPRISWCQIGDALFGRSHASLRDVLRHEYAHALADLHRGLIRSREFTRSFGAAHSWRLAWEHDPEIFVSEYAATAPAEDFAETFMVFVRHQGILPSRFAAPAIRRKWRFIARLAKAVRLGVRRW